MLDLVSSFWGNGALCTFVAAEMHLLQKQHHHPLSPQHPDNQLRSLPLDDRSANFFSPGPEKRGSKLSKRNPSACSGCTKVFCRDQNLPFCKDAKDEDMQTMCFQRDSVKDRFIVWGFILGVFGLLGWAGARKIMEIRGIRAAGTGTRGGRFLSTGGLRNWMEALTFLVEAESRLVATCPIFDSTFTGVA
ncbi:unnamed protein product [Parascedosporium putredinis]|uniref:Uncharacterized protein n=1 Tax=Parascedosporium putredinis TaxID=1442378 RepID=A0A9P1MA78_9PEZI|nr:unnamed protein product [Parascedosporium putredinis]CAI7992264.1 unnamed protein product [Parascedosporium putredinis]